MAEQKKRSGRVKKALFWIGISILFMVGAACFGISYMLSSIDRGDTPIDPGSLSMHEGLRESVKNIAVFGVDNRDDGVNGRSDAMMIVSLDFKHNKIKAVSIMRDSLVEIPEQGKHKINSAFARGGVSLAIKTINENFKMNIEDYVALNFNQMAGIVDALGGVEVEITEAERRNANKYITEMCNEAGIKPTLIKESGVVTLKGYQAVSYARIRYVGNADFERTERQREVLSKLIDKALEISPLRYPQVLSELAPMIETSLTNEEIMSIATKVIIGGKPSFEQGRFPIDGTYTTNSSYSMVYDMDEAADKLHSFVYDDEPFYPIEDEEDEEMQS